MATVTKTIKSGGDYTSPAAWEADLDDTSIYSSGDTAIGECSGEHELTSQLAINSGGTVGLTQTRLTAPEADRHDGTAGSGTRFTLNMSSCKFFTMDSSSVALVQRVCEWIEFDFEETVRSGDEYLYIQNNGSEGTAQLCAFSHNLLHSMDSGSNLLRLIWANTYMVAVYNNIIYDCVSTNSNWNRGIAMYFQFAFCANNTVYNFRTTGSGANATGIWTNSSIYDDMFNNISVGTSGTSAADYNSATSGSKSNNLSSDSSAPGTDAVTGESATDLFVSTAVGSEDLHLKAGAAAIGAGVDLGTSYTSSIHGGVTVASSAFGSAINYDIDNYDREDADDWDIGADQFVSAAAKIAKSFLLFMD